MAFAEGDKMPFDCAVSIPIKGADGKLVLEDVEKTNKKGETYTAKKVKQEVVLMKEGEVITHADARTCKLIGCPKGRLAILTERGMNVWRVDSKGKQKPVRGDCRAKAAHHTKDCCTLGMLMSCDDFDVKQSKLYEIVSTAGHVFLLLPKFHCELAPVERVWCRAKWWCRRHCGYSIVALRKSVGPSLQQVGPTLVRKYWNTTFRLAKLYAVGHDLKTVEVKEQQHKKESAQAAAALLKGRATHQYSGHREHSAALDALVED